MDKTPPKEPVYCMKCRTEFPGWDIYIKHDCQPNKKENTDVDDTGR